MRRLFIDEGYGAVYDPTPAGDAPLKNPMAHLDYTYWSNQFEHIGIVTVNTYPVTLPRVDGGSVLLETTYTLGAHGRPSEPFVYGYITLPSGARRPFAMHAVVDQSYAPQPFAFYGPHGFNRMVSLGVDGPNIVLHLWARENYWSKPQPGWASAQSGAQGFYAVDITVTVFVTDMSITRLQSTTPHVVDKSFVISSTEQVKLGPVDATRRWLRKATTAAVALVVNGPTMRAVNWAHWRYKLPAESAHAYEFAIGSVAPPVTATSVDITA